MLTKRSFSPLKDWSTIKSIYEEAFPKAERIPFFLLYLLSLRKHVSFTVYLDQENYAGFSYVIENDRYATLLYLAVNAAVRGKGYGGKILSALKQTHADKEIVFNLEPLDPSADNHEQRRQRLAFYEKNGFHLVPYTIKEMGLDYAIMTQTGQLDVPSYQAIFHRFSFGLDKVIISPNAG